MAIDISLAIHNEQASSRLFKTIKRWAVISEQGIWIYNDKTVAMEVYEWCSAPATLMQNGKVKLNKAEEQ